MKIILGSSSPRRQSLLSHAGFEFTIVVPATEEIVRKGESPRRMVQRLADEKARAITPPASGSFLIITADTTVVAPSGAEVLNKPRSAAEAHRILKKIQGRKHTVLTGYTLLGRVNGKIRTIRRVVKTQVEMRKLNSETIRAYVATREPMDKAGAYAAQGIGMGFISSIRGSYTNVVGLPISELVNDLETYFKVRPKWTRKNS